MARTGRVYVLRDPSGNMVYCGSTEDPYRLTRHRNQCKSDGLASPLYRYANEHHGGMAGYGEETLATINLPEDDEQAKALLRSLEGLVIRGLLPLTSCPHPLPSLSAVQCASASALWHSAHVPCGRRASSASRSASSGLAIYYSQQP